MSPTGSNGRWIVDDIGLTPGERNAKVLIYFDRALDFFRMAIILVPVRLKYKVVDFNWVFL